MSNIAEKLRELSRWLLATDTDIKMPDGMIDPEIAADYTEALEAYVAEKKLLAAENERLRAALKPSVDTKAAYIGEFSFPYTYPGEDGEEVPIKVTVPWTTIKEIMAAIRTHAALQDKSDDPGEGKAASEGAESRK